MDINDIYQSALTLQSNCQLKTPVDNQFTINIADYLLPIIRNIKPLKRSIFILNQQLKKLKQHFLRELKESIKKIVQFHYKMYQQKFRIQQQLSQSKYSQNLMKQQVIQLREMINQFLIDNSKQINKRDRCIFQLEQSLKFNGIPLPNFQDKSKIEQQFNLTSIQQVTQDQVSKESSKLCTTRKLSQSLFASQKQSQPSRNNIKNFINNFRKTINESNVNEKDKNNNANTQIKSNSYIDKRNISKCNLSINQSHQTIDKSNSLEASCNQLLILGESSKINQLLKNDSPKHISFIKRKPQNSQVYCVTEGNQGNLKQNYSLQQSILRKNHQRNNSGERQSLKRYSSRTSSRISSASKEKIKVTTRIVEEANTIQKKRAFKKVGSVRLGGKHYISKIRTTVKQAFDQYKLWQGDSKNEIKYQGLLKQNCKEGFGKLYYKNGFVYEGFFIKNYKHGKGVIHYKQKTICQGTWEYGQLNGQAFINLGIYSNSCSETLKQAIFKGNMNKNLFEGSGEIIFSNLKQKIVTKFHSNVPSGQFTLYTQNHIDFGFWPQ